MRRKVTDLSSIANIVFSSPNCYFMFFTSLVVSCLLSSSSPLLSPQNIILAQCLNGEVSQQWKQKARQLSGVFFFAPSRFHRFNQPSSRKCLHNTDRTEKSFFYSSLVGQLLGVLSTLNVNTRTEHTTAVVVVDFTIPSLLLLSGAQPENQPTV